MNAIRLPSGDHDARSPKCVRRVTFFGGFSSGFPFFGPSAPREMTSKEKGRR